MVAQGAGGLLAERKGAGGGRRRGIVAIIYGYHSGMEVSTAEAKNRLPELIRKVEAGERVIITRHGKPVAQITPPPKASRKVRFGSMRGRIKFLPGWDDPIDPDRFLEGDL